MMKGSGRSMALVSLWIVLTQEPVLIIKTAWGGKSLAVDFRPPGAGPYQPSERGEGRAGKIFSKDETGHYYREMITFVKETLKDEASIQKVVPGYEKEDGYELSGLRLVSGME